MRSLIPVFFRLLQIDLKLSRSEVKELSKQWANQLGYKKKKLIVSTQFAPDDQYSPDNDAKTFLEYEYGVESANELMKTELPIWTWRTRFCQEHQLEEFRVWLSPAGALYGFVHDLPNDRYLPSISQSEAEKLVCQFIEKKAGISLVGYKRIKKSSYSQVHRVDHSFTWEKATPDYKGARLRIQAGVSGNQVTQFCYFLYVPEYWQRKFSTVRSYNNVLQSVASIFYLLIRLASIFIFLWGVTVNKIRWRLVLPFAAFVALINVLDSFNGIADVIDDYNTHNIYLAYLIQFVVTTLYGALGEFLTSLILIGAAELVYRVTFPDKPAWENLFSLKGLRNITTVGGIFIGYAVLGIHLGVVALYYLIGNHCNFWCPLGVDNYQVLSDVLPFFSAVALGISAAVPEELMYRVLALGAVQQFTKSFWLANLFQAAAWGFMHSNYAQQPAYARGIELTLVGMFYGWMVRRYGIVVTLVGHYLVDALLTVQPLWSSHDLLLKLSTLVPGIIFVAIGLYALWLIRKRGLISNDEISNRAVNQLEEANHQAKLLPSHPSERTPYSPLPTNLRALVLIVALASLALALPFRRQPSVGDSAHLVISRDQALILARASMLRHHLDPNNFREVAWLSSQTDETEKQYLFEKVGMKKTIGLVDSAEPDYYAWNVRFFRVLNPEEYTVYLDKSGKEIEFGITEPEEAPGATLNVDEARAKAEAYLSTRYSVYRPYEFDSLTENHRPARTDYTFTFKVPKFKVADADFKLSVNLLGDSVAGYWGGWDIPDDWLHERQKKHIRDEIFTYMRTILAVIGLIAILNFVFRLLKKQHLQWRRALLGAIPFLVLNLLSYLNFLPQYFRNYNTTTPLNGFIIKELGGNLQSICGTFAMYVVGLCFALAAAKEIAPKFDVKHFCAALFNPGDPALKAEQRNLWLDSVLTGTACLTVNIMLSVLADVISSAISPSVPIDNFADVCYMANCFSPVLSVFSAALINGANCIIALALLAGLYKKYCKNFWFYCAFIVLMNVIPAANEHYWQDYLVRVISGIGTGLLLWFAVKRLIGLNPLAYFLIGVGQILISHLFDLIDHGLPLFINQLVVVCLLLLLPLFYLIYLFLPLHGDDNDSKQGNSPT